MTAALALATGGGADLTGTRRSAVHKLALALVWLTVASGFMVITEPAPADVLTLGLLVLLPAIGLVAISPALLGLLALMLVAAAAAYLAATGAAEIGAAVTHTSVTLYLYAAAFVFAAFVAKRPDAHTRLILSAYTFAAVAASAAGIIGYFDLVPGAYEFTTRYGRASVFFKDPNVFGPFLVPAVIHALGRLTSEPMRKGLLPLTVLLIVGFGLLLSFSRGAWINFGSAFAIYGLLRMLTIRSNRTRLRFMALAAAGLAAAAMLVVAALQFEGIGDLLAERAALTQSYDEGPEGRFGGQEKAIALIVEHPLGIGAQQFVPTYHHEEPHNVYLAMFLNAGWVGGLVFLGLVGSTMLWGLRHALARGAAQPLFLVAFACFAGNVLEGVLIDLDHWRHFYLLMGMVWGTMVAAPGIPDDARRPSGTLVTSRAPPARGGRARPGGRGDHRP